MMRKLVHGKNPLFWSAGSFWACLAGMLALLLSPSPAPGAETNASSAFDAANRLYEQGKFSEAADAYEKLLQTGTVSSAIQFNLGNAFFKSGQLGRALESYRRAEQISPRDPELRANLHFVRDQVQTPSLPPNRWQRWMDALTLNEWTLLAAAAFWLWILPLILLQWRPQWKPLLRTYLLCAGAAAALLGVGLAAVFYSHSQTRTAIVTAREAIAHNGPLDESPTAFSLHDGAEASVLDEKGDWLQVSAGPQRIGWVRRDQAVVLPST